MNSIISLSTKQYPIKINNFEGPLDLLCHLIDKNKMDIYEINISEITEQYLQFLNEMKELNLEIASEFLIMASTLLYIKSKNLLPKQNEEDEEEITEEELIKRIIEYKKYKEISKVIKENFDIYSTRLFNKTEAIELPKQIIEDQYLKEEIPNAYAELIRKNKEKINENAKNIDKIALIDKYTVESKVKEIFRVLIKEKRFVFNKMYSINKKNKQEVMTAFTGLLELSRRNKVLTNQEKQFGDIIVEKARKNNA